MQPPHCVSLMDLLFKYQKATTMMMNSKYFQSFLAAAAADDAILRQQNETQERVRKHYSYPNFVEQQQQQQRLEIGNGKPKNLFFHLSQLPYSMNVVVVVHEIQTKRNYEWEIMKRIHLKMEEEKVIAH